MPASQLNRCRAHASALADHLDIAVDHHRFPVGTQSHKDGVQWPGDLDCRTGGPEVAFRSCFESRLPAPTCLGSGARDARTLASSGQRSAVSGQRSAVSGQRSAVSGGITLHDVTLVRRGGCGDHDPVDCCRHPLDLDRQGPHGFGQCRVLGVPRRDISGSSSGDDSLRRYPPCNDERLGDPDAARSARSPSR